MERKDRERERRSKGGKAEKLKIEFNTEARRKNTRRRGKKAAPSERPSLLPSRSRQDRGCGTPGNLSLAKLAFCKSPGEIRRVGHPIAGWKPALPEQLRG